MLIVTFQPRQDRASLTQPNFHSLPSIQIFFLQKLTESAASKNYDPGARKELRNEEVRSECGYEDDRRFSVYF